MMVATAAILLLQNQSVASELGRMEGNYQQQLVLLGEQGSCNPNSYQGEILGRTGAPITKFCWYLDLDTGKIQMDAGFNGAVETFQWTPDGLAFLRFSTRF